MNREQITEIVRNSIASFIRGYSYAEITLNDLSRDGEILADQIVEDIFRGTEPEPVAVLVTPSKTRSYPTAPSVSAALGRYRDDVDGKPLGRAVVRNTRFGPVQYGGYQVKSYGRNEVRVRWIAPDSMNDEKDIADERYSMLTWYGDILRRAGYIVRNELGTALHVTR